MSELLTASLAFPTVVFTILLGIVMLYWTMVIVGALGLDALDFLDLDSGVEALDGATEGVDSSGLDHGGGGVLTFLGFGKVPATIVVSSLALWAWACCVLGVSALAGFGLPGVVVILAVPAVAMFVSGLMTGLLVRVLGRFIVQHKATRRKDLLGKVCTVTTGRVDANFGQAIVREGGDEYTVQVRCDPPNALVRHSQALLVAYDPEHDFYTIEAYDQPLVASGA